MERSGLRLLWSMPPEGQRGGPGRPATGDWLNLELSGVRGVMIPYQIIRGNAWVLDELAAHGASVIVRLLDGDICNDVCCEQVWSYLQIWRRKCKIELLICGNESDLEAKVSFRWGGKWGNEPGGAAERSRDRLATARKWLEGSGVPLASGALSCQDFRENDPAQPGLMEWCAIIRPETNRYKYNVVHAYTYNWLGDVDRVSIKNRLQLMAGLHHRELVLGELGIKSSKHTQMEKVRAYMEVCRWLCDPGFGPSSRYVMAIPYISTGTDEWASYLIKDVECYREMRRFVAGK